MAEYTIDQAIVKGKLEECIEQTNLALADGVAPQTIINDYMIKGMEIIGEAFQNGTAFVPNLLMAARAMKGALDILKPLLKSDEAESKGVILIGTVKGDLHDIGKNLVASMLEGCGFDVINLGVNVTAEQFVAGVKEHKANIICMSALLTTTMVYMGEVIELLKNEGLRDQVKVMVGGAPISDAFAEQIGADGYSSNANSAVALARELLCA